MAVSKNPIVESIINGKVSEDIFPLLFSRTLPLTDEEYLEAAGFVSDNQKYYQSALNLIAKIPSGVKENYVRKKEAAEKICFILLEEAIQNKNSAVLINLVQNSAASDEILKKIAAHAEKSVLEILVDNQVRLIACPDILKAMETNPEADAFIKQKIHEIRSFYLEDSSKYKIEDENQLLTAVTEIAAQEEQSSTEQEVKEKVKGIYERIKEMSVADRVKLALSCSKTERMILIKDPNRLVQISVLSSPKISDDEILTIVRDRSISGEIVDHISQNRDWTKNYQVMLALVQNPKTSINRVLSFLKNLYMRDLKIISTDRNVPGNVRQAAANLIKERERTNR